MKELVHSFPDDADGQTLRNIEAHGSDLSQPMLIDFAVDAPSQEVAEFVVSRLKGRGLVSNCSANEIDNRWSVYIPVLMTPNYDEIVLFQKVLDDDLAQFGAKSDGWGSFGNKDTTHEKQAEK